MHVIILLCLVVGAAGPVTEDDRDQTLELTWARALMDDFGYLDLAESVLDRLVASKDDRRRLQGLYGLSELRRLQARRAEDVAERERANAEALEMLRRLTNELPRGTAAFYDSMFDLGDLLQEITSECIRLLRAGRVPADQIEALRESCRNRLAEAEVQYARIEAGLAGKDREDEPELWFMGRKARLFQQIVKYRKARLIGTDPAKASAPRRVLALIEAAEQLEDFLFVHETEMIGMYGFVWLARVKAELIEAGESVPVDDVVTTFAYVPAQLTPLPSEVESGWRPASHDSRALAQLAYHGLLEFLNEVGRTEQAIDVGERFRERWSELGYELDTHGLLAWVELARARRDAGESGRALELLARVAREGGYAGREAEQLLPVVLRMAVAPETIDPEILAAGAHGAFRAGARDPERNRDALALYRLLVKNLDHVADRTRRDELGRVAWFRRGLCQARAGRNLEAAICFENGYRRFNNASFEERSDLNERMRAAWESSLRRLVRDCGGHPWAKRMLSQATSYMIAHPPQVPTGLGEANVVDLEWTKAERARREGRLEEARRLYDELTTERSRYQAMAFLRKAEVSISMLRKQDETASREDWLTCASWLRRFDELVSTRPDGAGRGRSTRAKARFRLSECHLELAGLAEDEAGRMEHYRRVAELTAGFASDDANLREHARYNRLRALLELGRLDEAWRVYEDMLRDDPGHRTVIAASLSVGKALRRRAREMPGATAAEEALRDDAMRRASAAYRRWLIGRDARRVGYWTLVADMLFDLEDWAGALDLYDRAIAKFEATRRARESTIDHFERNRARCLLELAKAAHREGDGDRADGLFADAAEAYEEIIGPDGRAPTTILEEAAQIAGGFVTGPDRHGSYRYFPGVADFAKAQAYWNRVYKILARKTADTPAAERELERRRERAYFYTFLLEYQIARLETSPRRLRRLERNLDALFAKQERPGGRWHDLFRWLRRKVG